MYSVALEMEAPARTTTDQSKLNFPGCVTMMAGQLKTWIAGSCFAIESRGYLMSLVLTPRDDCKNNLVRGCLTL